MREQHEQAQEKISADMGAWTSNTVIVVDASGGMRAADVWGMRMRLGAVWVSVALDFIAHRLESGEACVTDVVSIVTLGPTSTVLVEEGPCDWVLRNWIVSIYSWDVVKPQGHGPFLPSLDKSESLRNSNASCAVALMFLSDGAPSDSVLGGGYSREEWKMKIERRVGAIAKMFGRRLTFTAIGIGECKDFGALQQMVDAALDYGAMAELQVPSTASLAIGSVFTSVAASLTTTKTEMTDVFTLKRL
jgi:hypothetical protein